MLTPDTPLLITPVGNGFLVHTHSYDIHNTMVAHIDMRVFQTFFALTAFLSGHFTYRDGDIAGDNVGTANTTEPPPPTQEAR